MGEPPSWLAAVAAETASTTSEADILIRLLWVVLLLLVNAFFVAAEFSIVSVRRSRIAQLASQGDANALLIQQEQEQLRQFLSTTQLCITISSLALGWIGAMQVAPLMQIGILAIPGLGGWLERPSVNAGAIAVLLTFSLLTYLQVLLGELIPKTLAIIYSEPTALQLIKLSSWTKLLLLPLISLLDWSSDLLLKLCRIPVPDSATLYDAVTSEELQLLIASSGESGSLEEEERELLANVFEFGDTVASEVMTPRTSIDAIAQGATVRDLLAEVAESNHSRYPVMEESLDTIQGTVQVKDVVGALGREECSLDSAIAPFVKSAHFEHENKRVGELLSEMQEQRLPLVMVVDEFGGTAGLITVRDLVEEIVGRISDDGDGQQEPEFQRVSDSRILVQAQVDLDEVNEELSLELPLQDDYQTLGGFLIYHMQKIPKIGETFVYNNLIFTVVGVDGPRLDRVQIEIVAPAAVEENETLEEAEVAEERSIASPPPPAQS
ncbi:hemolysin family protein [Synechococcus sp. PCC 7336]|uniref:hemolysin family protein n=1 Tax=Synechococcus sp. PCC 7336 TaxID=195250 RepID=UPI00034CDC00|nr:hemolysin family protein [Synechococcus sp. PCC 7336]